MLTDDERLLNKAGKIRCRMYVIETADGLELRAQAGDGATCQTLDFPLKAAHEVERAMEAFALFLREALNQKQAKGLPGSTPGYELNGDW